MVVTTSTISELPWKTWCTLEEPQGIYSEIGMGIWPEHENPEKETWNKPSFLSSSYVEQQVYLDVIVLSPNSHLTNLYIESNSVCYRIGHGSYVDEQAEEKLHATDSYLF